MNIDNKNDILKMVILPIILYIVYLLIALFSINFDETYMWILCGSLAILITPFYNRTLKFFFDNKENLLYFVLSTVIFFGSGIVFGFILFWIESILFSAFVFLQSTYMYIIGNGVYVLGHHLINNVKGGMYGNILKRTVSSIICFIFYLPVTFIPESSFSLTGVIIIIVVITIIFHFIFEEILKISYESIQAHAIQLSFFVCIFLILSFTGVGGSIYLDLSCVWVAVAYVMGNGIYYMFKFIWKDYTESKTKDIDKYCEKDENDSDEISSEMILIPGIDEELKEEGNHTL